MLTAFGLDQPVYGVIGEGVAGADDLVAEVHHLLRIVGDMDDVTGGVVCVLQVLKRACSPGRHQSGQP